MFQSFDSTSNPAQGPARLSALRDGLAAAGVDGFVVPRADRFQGEYVAPCDERLAWLTGFTGSAGFAVVLGDLAGVFIDGRYRVQVRDQVADVYSPVHWPQTGLPGWLIAAWPQGGVLGYDPWLHTVDDIAQWAGKLSPAGIRLQATDNLVDAVWHDRPARPKAAFFAQPLDLAGEDHASKRVRLALALQAEACIITLPDSIAWLLNIRGADIARNPVPQAFAILYRSGSVDLFAPPEKVADLSDHLGDTVTTHAPDRFEAIAAGLTSTVQIDPASCPQAVRDLLAGDIVSAQDPCILPKACKNPVEIAGAHAAHLRDGAAVVRFLAWLDATAPGGTLTEIAVVTALERFRRETGELRDISFETICGAGAHGAVVHYRVTTATDAAVKPDNLLLIDSGGQYADGTTDITRTVIVGAPTAEQCDRYTRVLQGMIAISRAQFPRGVTGRDLDALARYPLWLEGLDYDHGTGHGVGSYLSVHEGPQGLSRRATTALEPGMILSNEPGYYREGHYGIRIENLIVVIPAPDGPDGRDMLAFDTLTRVPLDRRLIQNALLSGAEKDWIDRYHADTLRLIAPLVEGAARDWLEQACAPL